MADGCYPHGTRTALLMAADGPVSARRFRRGFVKWLNMLMTATRMRNESMAAHLTVTIVLCR